MKLSQIVKLPAVLVFSFSLLGLIPATAHAADAVPLKQGQIIVNARQESVPQKPGADDVSTQVIAVKISVRKPTTDTVKVTVKTEFFGRDADGGKRVSNASKSKEIELKGNAFTELSENSDPYVYTAAKKAKKGVKASPASGSRPLGWTVKVYQGTTLLAATASSPSFLADSAKD